MNFYVADWFPLKNIGLVWLFGFLVVIEVQPSTLYLNFVFAVMYCLLNSSFGLFILVATNLLAKQSMRQKKIATSPTQKQTLAFVNAMTGTEKRQAVLTPVYKPPLQANKPLTPIHAPLPQAEFSIFRDESMIQDEKKTMETNKVKETFEIRMQTRYEI
jgi:hypothetical protein